MSWKERWQILDEIGRGGQGVVYRVLSKEGAIPGIKSALKDYRATVSRTQPIDFALKTAALVEAVGPKNQRALKEMSPDRFERLGKSGERLHREIRTMTEVRHPNLLEICEYGESWFVSPIYSKGALAGRPELFKGDLIRALRLLIPLVDGVKALHERGYVHRDIKPENVFLSDNRDLILGDFGLVFYEDPEKSRPTETFENVGSWAWMPPWAQGRRVDEVSPAFDVFSLGKLLWAMVSGKQLLHFWYYNNPDRPEDNLELMFPDHPHMRFANDLFAKCIVEKEKHCLPEAGALLRECRGLLHALERHGGPFRKDVERPCIVCGEGMYQIRGTGVKGTNFGFNDIGSHLFAFHRCNECGHTLLFSFPEGEEDSALERHRR